MRPRQSEDTDKEMSGQILKTEERGTGCDEKRRSRR